MNKTVEEFKAFAIKGNVVDLAVAVVIGAAFGKIVTSLVENIVMPIVGILLGGLDFSGLSLKMGKTAITYGVFIQSIVDFAIVAFVIFMVVKGINHLKGPAVVPAAAAPAPTPEDVVLLREIRDALRK